MSTRIQLEIVAQPGAAPDAVMCAAPLQAIGDNQVQWKGSDRELRAFNQIGRLLPPDSIFDAKLTGRWGCLVACSREFSAYWRVRVGRPTGFFLFCSHE